MTPAHPIPSVRQHLRRLQFSVALGGLAAFLAFLGFAFAFWFHEPGGMSFGPNRILAIFTFLGAVGLLILGRLLYVAVVPTPTHAAPPPPADPRVAPAYYAAVDAELADAASVVVFGKPASRFRLKDGALPLYLTRSWLVQLTGQGVCLVRLDDFLWAWEQPPVRGWFFARGQSKLRVLLRSGGREEFILPDGEADRLLLWIVRRAPRARVGPHPSLDRWWQLPPGGIADLAAEVRRERELAQRLLADETAPTADPSPDGVRTPPGVGKDPP